MSTKAKEQYAKDYAAQLADGVGGPSVNAKQVYAQSFSGQRAKPVVSPTSAKSMALKARNERGKGVETIPGGTSPGAVQIAPVGGVSPTSQEPGAVVGSSNTPGNSVYPTDN